MAHYTHTEEMHNLKAPGQIVPYILKLISVHSVVDVGCGLGTFLKVFKENGVREILGIDGPWCKKELLFKNISSAEFLEVNMEERISIDKKFDLAVCLEVAEHLTEKRALSFVEDLSKLADVILFSAAIPRQGGDHHLNEQWLGYWEKHFNKVGYKVFDVLKPVFWDNKNIFWWYKQNMVLIVKVDKVPESVRNLPINTLTNVIHPDLFEVVTDFREKNAFKRYTRALYKSILFKLGLIK